MLNDDDDVDTALAFFMFVNHGTLPSVVAGLSSRERALLYAMAQKQIENRKKM